MMEQESPIGKRGRKAREARRREIRSGIGPAPRGASRNPKSEQQAVTGSRKRDAMGRIVTKGSKGRPRY